MPELDYFPFIAGLKLYYASVSYSAMVPSVVRLFRTVASVARDDGGTTAVITDQWGADPAKSYPLRLDAAGLWDSRTLLFPLPLKVGASWEADAVRFPMCSVASLKAKASTLWGDYANCLQVDFGDEDTGSGSRFYAPGVGLVREQFGGEGDPWALVLLDVQMPRP